ncbi:MAG TPA: ribokinase [Nocardioides sp.]|uniref:ribokinase n=1 Tax=Nocardioides sp. TaxID=35761 RepID=UPI002E363AEF|nr:ribokinase [Nocardioides sp.]HEX3931175.1 ribokinase [Nocardioides sp.]
MSVRRTVVVVGSLNRDYVCAVDRLPGPGETRLGSELTLFCGGKGGNQAVAAALVGAERGVEVAMVGAVGSDVDGLALRRGLQDAGVDQADLLIRRDVRSGSALITVAADGENTIVVSPGANATVTAEAATEVVRRRRPGVVLAQGELPSRTIEASLREAAVTDARPVLNLAPVVDLDESVLALCDPLVVNAGEAATLLGRDGVAARELARMLSHLARSVVVTAGPGGAWVGRAGVARGVPARPAEAVDSTGAGDAFTGAMVVGLALGHDLVVAAAWGAAVASYSVSRPGAQASFPRGRDIPLG